MPNFAYTSLALAVFTSVACASSNAANVGSTEQPDVGVENVPVCAAPCPAGA